jgi:hypothetical protein
MLPISFTDLVTCYIIAFLSLAMMFLSLASSVQIAFTCLKPKKYIESIWFLCLAVCHVLLTANVVASFSHQKKEKSCFAFPSTAQRRDHSLGSSYTPGPLLFSSFVYSYKDYTFFTMFLLHALYMSILRGVAQHCSLPYNTIRCIINVDAL